MTLTHSCPSQQSSHATVAPGCTIDRPGFGSSASQLVVSRSRATDLTLIPCSFVGGCSQAERLCRLVVAVSPMKPTSPPATDLFGLLPVLQNRRASPLSRPAG